MGVRKNLKVLYLRKSMPTNFLDYEFLRFPRNIIHPKIFMYMVSIWTIISTSNASGSKWSGYSRISRPHTHKIFYATQGILESTRQESKPTWVMENLLAHTFDYIVLINPGLTSCKTLLWWWMIVRTIISACNASYILPYTYMPGIIYLCFYRSHAYYSIAILIESVI